MFYSYECASTSNTTTSQILNAISQQTFEYSTNTKSYGYKDKLLIDGLCSQGGPQLRNNGVSAYREL